MQGWAAAVSIGRRRAGQPACRAMQASLHNRARAAIAAPWLRPRVSRPRTSHHHTQPAEPTRYWPLARDVGRAGRAASARAGSPAMAKPIAPHPRAPTRAAAPLRSRCWPVPAHPDHRRRVGASTPRACATPPRPGHQHLPYPAHASRSAPDTAAGAIPTMPTMSTRTPGPARQRRAVVPAAPLAPACLRVAPAASTLPRRAPPDWRRD